MKRVILAEKPSQGQAYAAALGKQSKKDGYIEINGTEDVVTWGFGHLVELSPPEVYQKEWKKWNKADLPILPETFKFQVGKGKSKQFNIVKRLLKSADEIIIATDSDREGENIARSIIRQAGCEHKPMKRLWINSLETEEIRKGFQHLKEAEDYFSAYIEAQTRQKADWLVGINLSRSYTLTLQSKGVQDGVFSVGRVQTPTLCMIYNREAEIDQFISKPFYELFADITVEQGNFKAKHTKKYETKEQVREVIDRHQLQRENDAVITSVETKRVHQPSPKLFALSDLQTFANRRFKISPSETLKQVQALYEKKLLSYPRSDCSYITESEFRYLVSHLEDYQRLTGYTLKEPHLTPKSRYVNNKKVQEHYAIIPTKTIPSAQKLNSLSSIQKQLYFTVLKRTLAMFEADHQYDETTIFSDVHQLPFKAVGKVVIQEGWKALLEERSQKKKAEEQPLLPVVAKGEKGTALLSTKEGKTQPPKLYTEGTLITAMKYCGRELETAEDKEILKEVEGIGTEATRANILETLKKQQYILSKSNQLTVTPKGKILCQSVSQTLLSSAEMTGKWERYLKKIHEGVGTQERFLKNIADFLQQTIADSLTEVKFDPALQQQSAVKEKKALGKCPVCGAKVVDKKTFYGCSRYQQTGCQFSLPKKFAGKNLSQAQLKKLLVHKETDWIKGFKKKDGGNFSAILMLDDQNQLTFKPYKKNAEA